MGAEQNSAAWTFAYDGQPAMRSCWGLVRLRACVLAFERLLHLINFDLGLKKFSLARHKKQQKCSTSAGILRAGIERVECASASEDSPSTPTGWWIVGFLARMLLFQSLLQLSGCRAALSNTNSQFQVTIGDQGQS